MSFRPRASRLFPPLPRCSRRRPSTVCTSPPTTSRLRRLSSPPLLFAPTSPPKKSLSRMLSAPTIVHDLPAGGRRFVQRADGSLHTIVAGEESYANGEPTGALPGRLVRGHQPSPNGAAR